MTRLSGYYRGAERGNKAFGELACWRVSLTGWAIAVLALTVGAVLAVVL